jgi:hypothetical protein
VDDPDEHRDLLPGAGALLVLAAGLVAVTLVVLAALGMLIYL